MRLSCKRVFAEMVAGKSVRVQDEAAREADRYARRGEWPEAEVHCIQAIASAQRRREREPDNLDHVRSLAELRYFHAEILMHLNKIPDAVAAARSSCELYAALVGIDPIHVADPRRDAQSRLGLLELMARDATVPYADRVPKARALAEADPGPEHDLDLARQLARQALDRVRSTVVDLAAAQEAVALYRRLRPLGEDDQDLFARVALVVAQTLADKAAYAEAEACAADAALAFGALAVRRPERYERPWYDARELATHCRAWAEGAPE